MAEVPYPTPRLTESALARGACVRANRAETAAMGFLLSGVVLLVIGLVLALLRGSGLACLVVGGISFLTGCIENVRAEVLYVRAKLEKD